MSRVPVVLAVAFSSLLLLHRPTAAEPSPPNHTVPACISLVGSNGATASAKGTFTVITRDLANNPVAGATVTVDLSQAPDLHLCALQLAPGIILDCPGNKASAITDATGHATFTLLGGGLPGAGSGLHNGRIYVDGMLVAMPTVSAYDLDGASGVGANDFSLWFGDFVAGATFGRSDYDCSGSIGANDLSFWLSEFGSAASVQSCAASCP